MLLRRPFLTGSICAAVLLAGAALGRSQPPLLLGGIPVHRPLPVDEHREAASSPLKVDDDQLREGVELVDQPGTFKMAGDRVVFFLAHGKQQVIGLENLDLERIVRILGDNTNPLDWFVSGTVTEFRGTNYLLVRRATFRNVARGRPRLRRLSAQTRGTAAFRSPRTGRSLGSPSVSPPKL